VSRTDLSPLILWRNRQTEVCLVLRPKPRNCHGDFEAQITKPELSILRPKLKNPPPPWFWGWTKKPTTGFEVKPGETVATSFDGKLEKTVVTGFETKSVKTVAAGFEVKPLETIATGFEAKPAKIVRVVLRPNHSQTISTCQLQTTHGVTGHLDRLATEYPTCAIIPSPLHQDSYSYHGPRRCTPCRTCHLHTTRQANTILQMKQM
jgi:hypothetical protein